jgi:hypothetical protein
MKRPRRGALSLAAALLLPFLASHPAAAQAEKAPAAPPDPASPGPVEAKGLTPLPLFGSTGQVTSGTTFNPSISVIPEFFYFTDGSRGASYSLLQGAEGFAASPPGEGRAPKRGFNLGETEVVLSAVADPYFDATAILSFAQDGVSVEEAYARTRSLPGGLALKAGKFYSGIGYVNSQHPHQWDFFDQNLPYLLLLGGAVNEAGLQVTWLPKAPVYLLVGAEALEGTNAGLANVVAGTGTPPEVPDRAGPRLFTGFVRISPDIGYADALQVGAWYAHSSQQQESPADHPGLVLDGTAWATGVNAIFKHDAGRPLGKGNFTLQAEYVYRRKDLSAVVAPAPENVGTATSSSQSGAYVQGTCTFAPRWTVNARWDAVGLTNDASVGDAGASLRSTSRISGALVFNPTEFSRIRAQYSRASIAMPGGGRETTDQLVLQLQISLGVHGAHTF